MDERKALVLRLTGGAVKRYHTIPIIGTQTVAEHSYRVAAILRYIDPGADVQNALDHDVAEVITGDLPFGVKKINPEVKQSIRGVEQHVLEKHGITIPYNDEMLHIADLLEMGLFGTDQAELGNKLAYTIIDNVLNALDYLDLPTRAWELRREIEDAGGI